MHPPTELLQVEGIRSAPKVQDALGPGESISNQTDYSSTYQFDPASLTMFSESTGLSTKHEMRSDWTPRFPSPLIHVYPPHPNHELVPASPLANPPSPLVLVLSPSSPTPGESLSVSYPQTPSATHPPTFTAAPRHGNLRARQPRKILGLANSSLAAVLLQRATLQRRSPPLTTQPRNFSDTAGPYSSSTSSKSSAAHLTHPEGIVSSQASLSNVQPRTFKTWPQAPGPVREAPLWDFWQGASWPRLKLATGSHISMQGIGEHNIQGDVLRLLGWAETHLGQQWTITPRTPWLNDTTGKPNVDISVQVGEARGLVDFVLLGEAKAMKFGLNFAAQAHAVDFQIRQRITSAYGRAQGGLAQTKRNPSDLPPPRLILLAFVGCLFRPYYWDSTAILDNASSNSGSVEIRETSHAMGSIRPNNTPLTFRQSYSAGAADQLHEDLWWSIQEESGKRVIQQVVMDVIELGLGREVDFPELYGEVGEGETQRRSDASS